MDKNDVVQISDGILLSHKKNEIMAYAATWMNLEIVILSEIKQTEKDKYHMVLLACGILKMIQINLFKKQKETHRQGRQTYGYQRRKRGRDELEV